MSLNQTAVTEFILEGFPSVRSIEIFLFIVFTLLYVMSLLGNVFLMILVGTNVTLHIPMYFFLANYAFMEVSLTCVITPKVLINLMSGKKSISFAGCLAQSYCFFLLGTADLILIAVMSYDRYLAVCKPLHYTNIMTWRKCVLLVILSWFIGFLSVNIGAFFKASLPYCGPNRIDHFFCDSVPLMQLSCMDTHDMKILDFLLFSAVILGTLIFIVFTYTHILLAVFQIKSANGRQKAFSTCTSHFTTMTIVYSSSIFLYVTPREGNLMVLSKLMSAITIFIIPVTNPFIFTFRNKQVQQAVSNSWKRLHKFD